MAARHDYDDVITKERIPAVTTAQIYKGSIAFIVLQIIMVGVILFNPGLVSGNIKKVERISKDKVEDMLNIETIDYNSSGSSNDNW